MGYRERVLRDLAEWRKAGWVTPDGAAAIAASLPEGRRVPGFAAIVGMLGAILIGAGLIAFIAANWQEIPRVAKLGGAVTIMAAAYLAAWAMRRRAHAMFAEAALLVAGMAFAGLIALLGQTYNMGEDFADLVAIWTGGTLAAALVLASPVMIVLGLVGGIAWTYAVTGITESPHWAGLIPVVAGGTIATFMAAPAVRFLAVVAFLAWAAGAVLAVAIDGDWNLAETASVAVVISLAVLVLAVALSADRRPRLAGLGRAGAWPGLAALLLTLGVLQMADEPARFAGLYPWWLGVPAVVAAGLLAYDAFARSTPRTVAAALAVLLAAAIAFAAFVPSNTFTAGLVGGAIVIAASVLAVHLGRTGIVPGATPTGLAAFGIEVVYIYIVTLGTVLDTSLVFVTGGLLFVVLAFGLYRLERRLARHARETPT